jgi:K+-sensing histidine kinase KdpD
LDELQSVLKRLRREGRSQEGLARLAARVREITGASVVVLSGGLAPARFEVAVPSSIDVGAVMSRLRAGTDATDVLGLGAIDQLVAAPLDDPALGPDAVLVVAWNRDRHPDDDDLATVSAAAAQIAWALSAIVLEEKAPTRRPPGYKDPFISFLAHELRTPLTPMMMLLQSLERKAHHGAVDLEAIARARRQTVRLARMIGDLVDLSKLREHVLELDRAPLDLGELLNEISDQYRPTMHKHRLELTVGPDTLTVDADRMRLERVALNLLEQAERLVPSGGTLRVEARADGAEARVTFLAFPNEGAPAQPVPVFEQFEEPAPFTQLRGQNLGLYVAQGVTAEHGGTLSIETPEGQLPRLVVRLPMAG